MSERSNGRFKPSVVGGYERGERGISLARFCELAHFYGVPADRLLRRVLDLLRPERRELVLDLGRLEEVGDDAGRAVAAFVQDVKRAREDRAVDQVTLRAGDLEAIALSSGIDLQVLLSALQSAIRGPGARET